VTRRVAQLALLGATPLVIMPPRAQMISRDMASSSGESELIELDEDHAKAIAFNMIFVVWRHRTLVTAYQAEMKLVEELGKRCPEGVGILNVIELEAQPPGADARAAFVQLLNMPQLRHFSVTHEGAGFKAASIRAVVAGTHAFARPKCSHSVHRYLSEAARWHAKEQKALKHEEPAERIERVAFALRGLHRHQYPG
jgi:hypothetical protein